VNILPEAPQRRRHDFTLTMINIVFLLLLFFLITGSLINRNEAQSGVPTTSDLPLERLPRPLLLMQTDGSLQLDGRPVSREAVAQALRDAVDASGRANVPVSLLADPGIPAADLLSLVDLVRAAKVQIRLVTVRQSLPGGASP
jgi:biopolymer transport protein ExbD